VTKKIQTETKLGRFTVSFLLLHICEEKDENEEFDFKLSLKSNNGVLELFRAIQAAFSFKVCKKC
jgi:hypothetical protein